MDTKRLFTVYECVKASSTGELKFPEILGRLAEVRVERYHTDYTRMEKTFYFADDQTVTTMLPVEPQAIGQEFVKEAIVSAVLQSQRNEHTYADFLTKTMAAGCVGYFVHIAGRHAVYLGRKGETHVEPFPSEPSV
jgi:uncharacterized protein YbcV (DUF1398 family)